MSASVARIPGVLNAELNFASATLLVEFDPANDPRERVVREVEATGHGLQSLEEAAAGAPAKERPWLERNRAEVATIGSGIFSAVGLVLGWLKVPGPWSTLAFAIAILFGGLLVWRRAIVSLRARMLDMNVLMTLAVFGAAALGEWGEGASVFFLFALGGLLESRSLERTRNSIRDLMDLAPPVARVWREGEFVETALGQVVVGDKVLVRPGERLPVDGVISKGSSAIDEAAITGESVPAEKTIGSKVFAGTLNTSGLLEVETSSLASESTLSRIVYLVEEAQSARAPMQTFVERFSAYYTPAVISLAVGIAVVPPVMSGAITDPAVWSDWIQRALVMLVVSCPCALVISTPVSVVSGITRASRSGILIKGGAFLEKAASIHAVAFDKTGTLTVGRPEVADVIVLNGMSREDVLGVAGALETHSSHPLARAVVRAAGTSVRGSRIERVVEVPGEGVRGVIDGVDWEICSPACAKARAAETKRVTAAIEDAEGRGLTTLVLLRGSEDVAVFGLADLVRPEARESVAALRNCGVEHLVMLTGDNERVGEAVTAQAGLTGFLARLLPEGKTDAVRVLQERYGSVAMVGDGVNDAPALAISDLGIAMGAAASDTALETADVALLGNDLRALPTLFDLGVRTKRTIIANITFSIAVKVVFLVLALTGVATLWMAVFADTGVSLLVILNGMRLLRAGDVIESREPALAGRAAGGMHG